MTERQDRTDRILALMRGEGRGLRPGLSRFGLWILSRLYAFGIGAYWSMYRYGILKRERLRPYVISVGNITVGGTGKTTTIQYLAGILQSANLHPAILSYGYRAGDKAAVAIVSDGREMLMTPGESGDEAALLAGTLPGVPVLIGRRRVLSGAEAERRFRPDVLLCDDAFQYWRLERDLDLVLVDATEPWGYGHVLPRGVLREPKQRIRRADAVIVTHADLVAPTRLDALVEELGRMGFASLPPSSTSARGAARPLFLARHSPSGLSWMEGGSAADMDALRGLRVLAVSSLGDPASYEATLVRAGADVESLRFPDHHGYTTDEVRAAEASSHATGRRLVTTAKDAVKLRGMVTDREWRVLDITLDVDNEPAFREWVLNRVRTSNRNGWSSGPGARP